MLIAERSPELPTPSARQRFAAFRPTTLARSVRERRAAIVIDMSIAVLSFCLFTMPVALGMVDGHGSTAAIAVLGALAAAPLLVRRPWPVGVLVGVTIAEVVASLLDLRFTPFVSNAGPVLGIAIYTVADRLPWRRSLLWSGSAIVATSVAAVIALFLDSSQDQDAVQLAIAAPAWLLGDAVRMRREQRQRLDVEAQCQATEREARIRAEERLRVSRDVHDVVSHTLSMIAVRSGVATLLIDSQPQEARLALAAIETTSRSALVELRQVLRQIQESPGQDVAMEPGLSEVGALIDGLRHGGRTLDLRVTGRVTAYDPVLETSVYRIIQEALTNVVKHAGVAAHVWITVHHAPGQLRINIVNDGEMLQAITDGAGLGLTGMRERVGLFEGTLEAGPRPSGGFEVHATLPTGGGDAG